MSLRDVGVTLHDCEHKTPPACDGGYPYIAIPQLKEGRINFSEARRITQDHFVEWTRKAKPQFNDVILSRRCNPGETAHVPNGIEFALGQNLVMLRSDGTEVFPPFLRWLLRSPFWWEQVRKFINVGAVFDSLKCADIPNFLLPIPPIAEQNRIAHILGTLDDKIEVNRQMNETLEATARALFKSWFVDFDPVRAKMDGHKPLGMDEQTAKLFPDKFAESSFGAVPKGWKVERLKSHIESVKGLSYNGSGLAKYGFPLHNLNSVYEGGGYKFEGIKFYTGEHKERHVIRPGDVIVTNTEQGHGCLLLGYAALVPERFGEPGLFSHHLYRVRPHSNSPFTAQYLVYLFNSRRIHDTVSGYGNGTTVNMLPQDALQKPHIVAPPKALTKRFTKLAASTFSQCEQNINENRTLAKLRDTLLPKLLSGEIRVGEAEKLIEGAV